MGLTWAQQTQYYWDKAAGEWLWWWNHQWWTFEQHCTFCCGWQLQNVWVSEASSIYQNGPNPWRAWLEDQRREAEECEKRKRLAKAALTSRLNAELADFILQL